MARIFVCPSYTPDVSTKSVNSGVFQHICFRLIVLSNKLPNQTLHLCLYYISPIQLSREYDSSFMNIARTEFTLTGNVKIKNNTNIWNQVNIIEKRNCGVSVAILAQEPEPIIARESCSRC